VRGELAPRWTFWGINVTKTGKIFVPLLAVVVCMIVVGPALADVRKGDGEIGFDIGGTEFDSELERSSAPRLDFRFGYQVTRLFQIEGQLGAADRRDVTLATGFANFVFNFPTSERAIPYFLVGGGAAYLDNNDADDTSGAAQLAGGLRAFGEEGRLGVRLELGATWEDTFDEAKTHINFVVGFTFALGRPHGHSGPQRKVRGY